MRLIGKIFNHGLIAAGRTGLSFPRSGSVHRQSAPFLRLKIHDSGYIWDIKDLSPATYLKRGLFHF